MKFSFKNKVPLSLSNQTSMTAGGPDDDHHDPETGNQTVSKKGFYLPCSLVMDCDTIFGIFIGTLCVCIFIGMFFFSANLAYISLISCECKKVEGYSFHREMGDDETRCVYTSKTNSSDKFTWVYGDSSSGPERKGQYPPLRSECVKKLAWGLAPIPIITYLIFNFMVWWAFYCFIMPFGPWCQTTKSGDTVDICPPTFISLLFLPIFLFFGVFILLFTLILIVFGLIGWGFFVAVKFILTNVQWNS